MQTNQLLAMFSGSLLLLGLIAFFLARGKAARVRASGTSMYAQPDQYGWFTVMSTAGPALVVGAVGSERKKREKQRINRKQGKEKNRKKE